MLYTVTRIVIVRMWQSTKAKVTREAELWPIIKVHSHRLGFSLWLLQLLHGIQPPGQLPTPPSDMQAIFDIVWRWDFSCKAPLWLSAFLHCSSWHSNHKLPPPEIRNCTDCLQRPMWMWRQLVSTHLHIFSAEYCALRHPLHVCPA